ncbi:hypothetical protein FRUB_09025 [Fimbriiglobus ruber]|uniref:Uncharacterized protein n=2 Tax=Fimbriiglobus ruber TaxID=1908690 RepID=A0A225D4N9_9BACT|nr:hypothetical protein FRUB_09025 [Fimbriiglobus ruber]
MIVSVAPSQAPKAKDADGPKDGAEPKPKVKAAAPAPAVPLGGAAEGPPSTTLYLFLATGADEREDEIVIALSNALKASEAKFVGELKLKAISPGFYQELRSLVDQVAPAAEADGLGVRRLPSRGNDYELTIEPTQVMKKLTVTYKAAGKKEYVPAGPGEKDAPLVLIVPGRYAFSPQANDLPLEYAADVAEIGKKDESKSGQWPATDKHYVVTLPKFVGNREQLFEKLKDNKVVANAFNVKRSDDLLFAFASLNSTADDGEGDTFGADFVVVSAENLKNSNVRRVWVYYPLDEAALKEAVAKFRDPKLNSQTLCQEIRKEAVPFDQAAAVKADDPPRWYELQLPRDNPGGRFARKIMVDNLFEMAGKYKTLGRLIVWEFDNGLTPPSAISTNHPKPEVGKVWALDREDKDWGIKVKKATERNKK